MSDVYQHTYLLAGLLEGLQAIHKPTHHIFIYVCVCVLIVQPIIIPGIVIKSQLYRLYPREEFAFVGVIT